VSALRGVSISQPGRLEQAADELATIMDAIERRDAESAARCFATYVRNAGEAALARIEAGALPSDVPVPCRTRVTIKPDGQDQACCLDLIGAGEVQAWSNGAVSRSLQRIF
jgi:stage V sporulation protein SpoVS